MQTRRRFLMAVSRSYLIGALAGTVHAAQGEAEGGFLVGHEELKLTYTEATPAPRLRFQGYVGEPREWREECSSTLHEVLGIEPAGPRTVRLAKVGELDGVRVEAYIMEVDETLSIPAYLLVPSEPEHESRAVMAIQGHGEVEGPLGVWQDYHNRFGLALAQAGHLVLCPVVRGFGVLGDLALHDPDRALDYWRSERGRQFTLPTDAFLKGRTMVGRTVEDLLAWEEWLVGERGVAIVDIAGISYGGDLAVAYGALSERRGRIYASGTMGSAVGIFDLCYNAPAHCIPGLLRWMDRCEIAGLCAPAPLRMQYGEYDTPSPDNNSASYNDTVVPAFEATRAIYAAFGARNAVSLRVTPGVGHEMDVPDLLTFLG